MIRFRCYCWVAVVLVIPTAGRADLSEKVQKHMDKGAAAIKVQDFDRALAEFTEAIRLDPKNILLYHSRAAAYHAKGDFAKVIADCTHILKANPRDSYALGNRGVAYSMKNDYDKVARGFG